MKKTLYKISEIAKFFNISTTTLRYYEKFGLLNPEYIDDNTRYRYYSIENINTLTYIIGLRKTGMGMTQIKRYLNGEFSIAEHLDNLKKQRFYLDKQIRINEALNTAQNVYDIDYVFYPSAPYIKEEIYVADINELYSKFLTFLENCAKKDITINNDVIAFVEFNSVFPNFKDINAVLGLEIKDSKKNIGYFYPQTDGIRTFHKGGYDTIGSAYEALRNFADTNDVTLSGKSIEHYYESFNLRSNPDEFLTEIIFPIINK